MNRKEAKNILPIVTAFSEGKTIQVRDSDCGWRDVTNDIVSGYLVMKPADFRIKPEPKYRPFKNADECWNEMQEHQPFGWIKSKNDSTINKFMFIDSLRNDEVSISNVDFNYNDLVKCYTFIDGTPFGTKK